MVLRGARFTRGSSAIIPVTNIAELVEYVLLTRNNKVTKPRALNTLLDGLAELRIYKGLIKNKKLLSDLIETEKGYRNAENISENESNNEESSSGIENHEEEEVASENGSEAEGNQESDNDTENDSQETVVVLKRPPPFTLKVPVNIVRTLMCRER